MGLAVSELELPPKESLGGLLPRFDLTERLVHWLTALFMFTCIATALPLYIPSLAQLIGRRELLVVIHVYSGILLVVPTLAGVASKKWGSQLRDDLKKINRWDGEDSMWFKSWGRDPLLLPGKFNAGQKANSAFIAGAILVMLMTGVVMRWFGPFPVSWRTGATFIHDLLAYMIVIVIVGHIGYAIRYPATIRAIVSGKVSRRWASEHAPAWVGELDRLDQN